MARCYFFEMPMFGNWLLEFLTDGNYTGGGISIVAGSETTFEVTYDSKDYKFKFTPDTSTQFKLTATVDNGSLPASVIKDMSDKWESDHTSFTHDVDDTYILIP